MKTASNSRVLRTIPLLIVVCVLLSGCLEFKSIEQPSSISPGEVFTVVIEASVEFSGENPFGDPVTSSAPYFGICLPNGWTILGDIVVCEGIYNETIIYDGNLTLEQENLSPAPEGYYWWVGDGNEVMSPVYGTAYGEIQIQTDEQVGLFSLDYMLGNSHDGLNQQRSNGHLVTADVHTPGGLQAMVEGEFVHLNWDAPRDSEGLVGYIIFRDDETISESFVAETSYMEEAPSSGLHTYKVAAFYSNGEINFGATVECYVFLRAGGSGTEHDPFLIATAHQLIELGQHPHLMDQNFRLVSDIDLDPNLPGRQIFDRAVIAPDTSDMDEGFQGSAFTGTFDGDGYTVSNLTIEGDSYLGLFGALGPEAQIIDVNVVNVDVTGNGWNIGAIAGTNGGTVRGCHSSGLVTGYSDVGGLVGSNDNGQIIDSHSTAVVVGIEYVGGVLGSQLANHTEGATVFNSFATGEVFGWHWIGGLVGFNQGTISKCSASSFVNGSSFLGGLVGYNDISGSLSNCYSCSTVQGQDALGGLVGSNMGSIRFAYSTGEVVGVSHIGGLVGISDAQAEVIASFWDVELSGQPSSEGGTGLNTAKLQRLNTYVDAGWDFAGESENGIENIWYLTSDGPAQFFYFEGMGTSEDPYLVDTVWHLLSIDSDPNMLDKHFKLTQHIDLDPNQLGSRMFTHAVIAPEVNPHNDLYYDGVPFSGTFDGCGYEIRNMRIIGSYHLGLFGFIDLEAHVSNLSVVDAYVEVEDIRDDNDHPKAFSQGLLAGTNAGEVAMCHTGGSIRGRGKCTGGLIGYNNGNVSHCTSSVDVQGVQDVGGLVGGQSGGQVTDCYSTGTVEQLEQRGDDSVGGLIGHMHNAYVGRCYATGDVNGTGNYIGGLVGRNYTGSISNSYSTGVVSGGKYVGGLVGDNRFGSITTSYSTGFVNGELYVGGLVGGRSGIVTHSFWDIETSGQSGSAGGSGLSTAQMQDIDTYLNAGWDFFGREFDGAEDIWVMDAYPVFYTSQLPGKGTIESPYLISEENKLIAFKNMLPSAHYRLTEDIDLYGSQWEGPLLDGYSGTFDGSGFSLRNVTIIGNGPLGLIGILNPNGTIENLKLENVFVEGSGERIGGLVGTNYGLVTHCECTGVVTGAGNYVGGLVGYNDDGSITSSYSTGSVSGGDRVGGLVGENRGSITTSYSTGSVGGGDRVGGLVGFNKNNGGHITTSCSTGSVSGDSRVGGLVGRNGGSITSSYSTGTATGNSRVGGLVGNNRNGSIISSYSTGAVSGDDCVGGLAGNNRCSITTSYSTGSVNGDSRVGGLVGHNSEGRITSSFWDIQTSGLTNMCGIQEEGATGCDDSFGLTTAEMKTANIFLDASWDFVDETANGTDNIWRILEGQDYPRLWWELSISADHPDYNEWLELGEPICWRYRRQCHGDADGKSQGKQKYWVSTNDLDVLIGAWNKPFSEIEDQTVNNVPLICADFDHKAQGTKGYRVSTNDLDILIANWNKDGKPEPNCP